LRIPWFLILFFMLFSREAWSQTTNAAPKKIHPPLFLKPTDKIPMETLNSPDVPEKGMDGNPLEINEAVDAPPADILDKLSAPGLFEVIKRAKTKEETRINQVYWHINSDLEYCHFRDGEGNHWYGWNDGQAFHWVLWRGNRYWWRDDFAGHWLYYGRDHWWRAGLQTPDSIQVLINGEYYLCQKDGTILKDMGQDGKGAIVSGNGPFRGDFHGGHGHGGGHGQGSGHSGTGANSSSNTGTSGTASGN
jgi:hypothetical protein